VQNAHVESFHGKLRDECLNASWFANLFEARRKIEAWRKEYNEERPHSSLGYRTPAAFARAIGGPEGRGKDGGFAPLENASRFPLSHSHDGDDPSLSGELFRQQNRLGSEGTVV
jgi:putative transposase